jgi:Na+-driven multidrug efflux pump
LPLWTFLNAQFSTARAGGDAIMGTVTDISVNIFLFLPGIFLVAYFTTWGPVLMYAVLKLTDVVKVIVAEWQLRKERWVKNLTIEN